MREFAPKLQAEGVRLACILQARADQLEELLGPLEYSRDHPDEPLIEWIPDPEQETHDLFGVTRMHWLKVFSKREVWRRQREAARLGFRQSWSRTLAPESDKLRNPAAFWVTLEGKILWQHRGEHPADLPSMGELAALADRL